MVDYVSEEAVQDAALVLKELYANFGVKQPVLTKYRAAFQWIQDEYAVLPVTSKKKEIQAGLDRDPSGYIEKQGYVWNQTLEKESKEVQLLKDILTLLAAADADGGDDDAASCTSSDSGAEESEVEAEPADTGSDMDTCDTQIPSDLLSTAQESLAKKVLPPVPKFLGISRSCSTKAPKPEIPERSEAPVSNAQPEALPTSCDSISETPLESPIPGNPEIHAKPQTTPVEFQIPNPEIHVKPESVRSEIPEPESNAKPKTPVDIPKPETPVDSEIPKPETNVMRETFVDCPTKAKLKTPVESQIPKPETPVDPKPETPVDSEIPKPETPVDTKPQTTVDSEIPKPETPVDSEIPKPETTPDSDAHPEASPNMTLEVRPADAQPTRTAEAFCL
ncbi:unnamed protein product [Symbiodinium sp. CCMP2592]|nr:unnamed protein product [Symbiodinium sp. CCMP2592]